MVFMGSKKIKTFEKIKWSVSPKSKVSYDTLKTDMKKMNEVFKNHQQVKKVKVGLPAGHHSKNNSKCPNLKDRLNRSKARSPQPLQIHHNPNDS